MKLFDDDLAAGLKQGLLLGAAVLVLVMPPQRELRPTVRASVPAVSRQVDFAGTNPSPDAERVGAWVAATADNGQQPFVILDKKDARVFVFNPAGRLIGSTPVLLGYAQGDDTVPGIGQRAIADVRPEERTTPAGRFVSEPGRNTNNEDVVWVDYEAAVSMHRVRLTDPAERRLERLQTPTAADNRISYGCINMPVEFFEQVLWPTLRSQRGIVYVMPETRPLSDVFPALGRPLAHEAPASRTLTLAPAASIAG